MRPGAVAESDLWKRHLGVGEGPVVVARDTGHQARSGEDLFLRIGQGMRLPPEQVVDIHGVRRQFLFLLEEGVDLLLA